MARFSIPIAPANPHNVIEVGNVRISVILPRLIRVETRPFTDYPTQKVWHRDLGAVTYATSTERGLIYVRTDEVAFVVDAKGRTMFVKEGDRLLAHFDKGNLKGTARTLDNTLGPIPLGKGLVSKNGVVVMRDASLLLVDEEVRPREGKGQDYYVFAYGRNYADNMRAYYAICGEVPLVPRYVLGNWWSRYKAYTQQEYMDVIERFEQNGIPITVATIDMDWHWTDVIARFGKEAKPHPTDNFADKFLSTFQPGWTGYSWNTQLFPDHRAMLRTLHEKGYHVTLNVHPSHGTRFFEDMYEQMCAAVGQDPATKDYVPFLLGNKRYLYAYFDVLHHPYEDEGVDFWWLDWQQGKHSDVPGLDPLWGLNHYHYLDCDRENKRPLILSRYAGDGSHRYPLGFSGDSCQNWASLRFQPYFTATATNAGYTWWSHDIGGHHLRGKDDELYLRWVQFGVFSPIHRLHSSANEFMGKEPWKCGEVADEVITASMRLRHRLIPYIYTANYRTHKDGVALCEPMYYRHADAPQAYTVPNQYYFGHDLLVAPITDKRNATTLRAAVKVWLPEDKLYTDIFTGAVYRGGGYITMYRDVASIPVLAPQGTILPMYEDDRHNDLSNDQPYLVRVFRGEGEGCDLYEDDGETKAYRQGVCAITHLHQTEDATGWHFVIDPARGDLSVLPAVRRYRLQFEGVYAARALVDGREVAMQGDTLTVDVEVVRGCHVVLLDVQMRLTRPLRERLVDLISSYQMNHGTKRIRFRRLLADPTAALRGKRAVIGPIAEEQARVENAFCSPADLKNRHF